MIKALLITTDDLGKYQIHGPVTAQEAVKITREAYYIILLCDGATAKRHKEEYNLFLDCVSNNKLRTRKELQVKTMEFVLGSLLSFIASIQDFPEPTLINFKERRDVINESQSSEEV